MSSRNLNKTDVIVALVLAIATFVLLSLDTDNLLLAFLFSMAALIYLLLSFYSDSFFGKKRQKSIFDSEAFRYLRSKRFKEVLDEGVPTFQGYYNDYFLSIYYSNQEDFRGRYGRVLVIAAPCTYPHDRDSSTFDDYIYKTYRKHKPKFLKRYDYEWYADCVVCKMSLGLINPKKDRLVTYLDRFVRILKEEKVESAQFLDKAKTSF